MHTYIANRTGDNSPTDSICKLTALLLVVGMTTAATAVVAFGIGTIPLRDATGGSVAQIVALGCVVVQALLLDLFDLGVHRLAGAPVDNVDNKMY